jgi:hypothetical protein
MRIKRVINVFIASSAAQTPPHLNIPNKFKKSLAKVFESDSLSAPFDPKDERTACLQTDNWSPAGDRIDGLANFEVADKNFYLCQLKHLDR